MVLRFGVLGPVAAWRDDTPVALTWPRYRALLGLLVWYGGRVLSIDFLAEGLWGAAAPATARQQIQASVSALRRALGAGSGLVTRGGGYLLDVDLDQIDLWRFKAAIQGVDGQPVPALKVDLLHAALQLWRGSAFDGVRAPYADIARVELEERRLAAVEALHEAQLAAGRAADAVPGLAAAVRAYPLRHRLRGQLMVALYRTGRQAEALSTYREGVAMLADEHGLDVPPYLMQLADAVLLDDPSLAQPEQKPVDSLPPAVHELVGREQELAALHAYVLSAAPAHPFVLCGPGGVGKTALAVHVAHSLRERFPDGRLFIDLHGLDNPLTPAEAQRELLRAMGVYVPTNGEGDLAVRASIELSYRILSSPAQAALRLVAAGGAASLPHWLAAELIGKAEVAAQRVLDELVDAQLLDSLGHGPGGHERYRIHDLIRLYANERLAAESAPADTAAAIARAVTATVQLATAAAEQVHGDLPPGGPHWSALRPVTDRIIHPDPVGELATEYQTAYHLIGEASRAGHANLAAQLAVALAPIQEHEGRIQDWAATHDLILAADGLDPGTELVVRTSRASALLAAGKVAQAEEMFRCALGIAEELGNEAAAAYAQVGTGVTLRYQAGRDNEAVQALTAAVGRARAVDDRVTAAHGLRTLAQMARAERYLTDVGDERGLARVHATRQHSCSPRMGQ